MNTWNVIKLDAVGSTNEFARAMIRSGTAAPFTAVWTEQQTQGKGQGTTKWQSVPGESLTVSLILSPLFLKAHEQFPLNMAISLAVQRFSQQTVPDIQCRIKWPNDLYLGMKKAGGILIENIWSGNRLQHSIIGIGINLNQSSFGDDLPHAVSFFMKSGQRYAPETSLTSLLEHIHEYYQLLELRMFERLQQMYYEILLGMGEYLYYNYIGQEIKACITGTDASGRLLLKTDSQQYITADLKEISLVMP